MGTFASMASRRMQSKRLSTWFVCCISRPMLSFAWFLGAGFRRLRSGPSGSQGGSPFFPAVGRGGDGCARRLGPCHVARFLPGSCVRGLLFRIPIAAPGHVPCVRDHFSAVVMHAVGACPHPFALPWNDSRNPLLAAVFVRVVRPSFCLPWTIWCPSVAASAHCVSGGGSCGRFSPLLTAASCLRAAAGYSRGGPLCPS